MGVEILTLGACGECSVP